MSDGHHLVLDGSSDALMGFGKERLSERPFMEQSIIKVSDDLNLHFREETECN